MPTILVLSEQTINQIAAGEVIENPASVVKELVENAIDAGATHISIETKGGGLQLLRVSDNGSGMDKEDALLCLERHATSKIRSADDLFSLETMGFRGEALASIASISKLTLTTALAGSPGTRIEVDGGEIKQIEVFARNKGTTIEVRSLFYNVPARKKFQKSSAICASEITRVATLLSLAYPHIGFTLVHQENEVFSTQKLEKNDFLTDLKARSDQVLGDQFLLSPSFISYTDGPLQIKGFLSSPMQTRNNRTGQYLFLNKRAVYCPLISYAVKDGFGTRIPPDRYPLYILHIDMPAKMLDVNVHPQKKEVRLKEEQYMKEKIREAVSSALQQEAAIKTELPKFSFEQFSSLQEPSIQKETIPFLFKEENYSQPEFSYSKKIKPLGIFSPYLLLDSALVKEDLCLKEEGIVLVDLEAARFRITFDSLMQKGSMETQALLLPIAIEVPSADAEIVNTHLPLIEKMGISLRSLGGRSYLIDGLPHFMDANDAKDALFHLIEEARSFFKGSLAEEKTKLLSLAISSFAGSKRKTFSEEESIKIFEELLKSLSPKVCPRGKQIFITLSKYDIEKLFTTKRS